jgi:hypothetical protein
MSIVNHLMGAYPIKIEEHKKLDIPTKPARIVEAAGYVHRNIDYQLENLGGKQWALMVINKDTKEKFERHPMDAKMLAAILDACGAIDFDNWDGAKVSLSKLQFKPIGVVTPKETPKEEKKPVAEKFDSSDIKVLQKMIGQIETGSELQSFLNNMGAKFREGFEANYGEKETKEFEDAHKQFAKVLMKFYGHIK